MEQSAKLPKMFEPSPPLNRWSFCSESIFHLQSKTMPFLHYHQEMEVGLCVIGSGTLQLEGRSIPFEAGDVQVVLPLQPHYNVSELPNTVWHFISFTPGTRSCRTSGVFTAAEHPELVRMLTSLALSAVRNPTSAYDEDRLLLQTLDVLVKLGTLDSDQPEPDRTDLPTDKIMPGLILLSRAIQAGKSVTIADMAKACHFSQSHFRKLFLEAMGVSPKNYLIQEQLKYAAQLLLTTSAPVSEIQQRAGFSDASVFFRNFVKKYRCSPSAFRKTNQQEYEKKG